MNSISFVSYKTTSYAVPRPFGSSATNYTSRHPYIIEIQPNDSTKPRIIKLNSTIVSSFHRRIKIPTMTFADLVSFFFNLFIP